MTILRAITLVLVTSAFALGGWVAGSAAFATVFELLRAHDMDAPLNSRAVPTRFQYAGVAAGFAIGALVSWRWLRPHRDIFARWEIYLAAGLGGAGGFALAHVIDAGSLAIKFLQADKDAYILVSFLSWFVLWLLGSALVATDLSLRKSIDRRLVNGAAGAALAFALIAGVFAVSNVAARSIENLGYASSGWANIRFPADAQTFPDTKAIKSEIRTPLGPDRAHPNEWRDENGRKLLAVMLHFDKYTRDRQLLVTLPDGPTLVFKPPFPANPKVRFGYGAWHKIDGFQNQDGTFRPADDSDDYAIRYMITR